MTIVAIAMAGFVKSGFLMKFQHFVKRFRYFPRLYSAIGVIACCVGVVVFIYGFLIFYLSFTRDGTWQIALTGVGLVIVGGYIGHFGFRILKL
jgi:hypothetical protein